MLSKPGFNTCGGGKFCPRIPNRNIYDILGEHNSPINLYKKAIFRTVEEKTKVCNYSKTIFKTVVGKG